MQTITISPVTRANMVASVTVMVEGGRVIGASNEGTNFRGFEKIMEGRDPRDAPYLTQRICGICSSAHGLAACRALETMAGAETPPNAILTRNLILGLDTIQNHLRHFFVLGLWDWVSPPPQHPFQGGYAGGFRFSPEVTRQFREHYWLAVDASRLAHETLTLLGGKTPHNHGIIPGGVSLAPRDEVMEELAPRIGKLHSFIEDVYLPDVMLLKETYPEYLKIGSRSHSYLSYGFFQKTGGSGEYFSPPGVALEGKREVPDLLEIDESHAYAWYRGRGGPPRRGETVPDPEKEGAYSWIKAPRYRGIPCEGGPLARQKLSAEQPSGNNGVMHRIMARALESFKIAGLLKRWCEEIRPGEPASVPLELPLSGTGIGVTDAMRGPLAHWVRLKAGRIHTYQIITPSAWNFSPKDEPGRPGPVEESLLDTPVENIEEPVEIGRVIRSFDPCYACASHVIDLARGRRTTRLL